MLEKNTKFLQPESRRNEIINFVKRGLKDISISRQSQVWGIPFLDDNKAVFYTWFDALTFYLHP